MKKLSRKNLDELAKVMPVLSETEQRMFVGGNSGGIPGGSDMGTYTWDQYWAMSASGTWTGGYVDGDYFPASDGSIDDIINRILKNKYGGHYIGPTDDSVLAAKPNPAHAADYIAMLHDLEYQKLGLSGVSGALNPLSKTADNNLIQRCNELISLYESGYTRFQNYEITKDAYDAAKAMKRCFELLVKLK